jgi:hypothetical protein
MQAGYKRDQHSQWQHLYLHHAPAWSLCWVSLLAVLLWVAGSVMLLRADACAMQVEVHRLVWFVGIQAFTVAMILFFIGLIRKMDPLNAFVNGFILVVVANVPEVSASKH